MPVRHLQLLSHWFRNKVYLLLIGRMPKLAYGRSPSYFLQHRSYFQGQPRFFEQLEWKHEEARHSQKESFRDHEDWLESRIHLSNYPAFRRIWNCSRRRRVRNSLRLCRTQRPKTEISLGQQYPITSKSNQHDPSSTIVEERTPTCIVTSLSSTKTSFVRKSAPIVAL